MGFVSDITQRGTTPLLDKTLAFTEARHLVLVENIANIDTPGYRTRQLDLGDFQAEMRRAADARKATGGPLEVKSTPQVQVRGDGLLDVTPGLEPAENLTFHDGTNTRVERQMAMLAENTALHQASVELLRMNYGGLMAAIRGRVQ